MPFESRLHLVRSIYPVAPPQLKADVEQVLLAYQQIEDGQDGAIPEDQVTRIHGLDVARAEAAIAEYTARTCRVDIGTPAASPTPTGGR